MHLVGTCEQVLIGCCTFAHVKVCEKWVQWHRLVGEGVGKAHGVSLQAFWLLQA